VDSVVTEAVEEVAEEVVEVDSVTEVDEVAVEEVVVEDSVETEVVAEVEVLLEVVPEPAVSSLPLARRSLSTRLFASTRSLALFALLSTLSTPTQTPKRANHQPTLLPRIL